MSNKNKKQHLTNKQNLEKEKMLTQFKKDIQQLEEDIKNSKTANRKIHALRGLKITLRTLQLIAPYVLTFSLVLGGFSAIGGTPFVQDSQKKKLETKKVLDSLGNIRYEQQYDEFSDAKGIITYAGKWQKKDDTFYSREIKTYSAAKLNEESIIKIIEEDNITSLEDILGKPISSKIQTQNNLTEEEIKEEPFLEAVIYCESDDDFIIVKESTSENILVTVLWFLVTILLEFIPMYIRYEHSNFDYEYLVERIKEKHPLIDEKELVKKLEIRRSNYNRLTGNYHE